MNGLGIKAVSQQSNSLVLLFQPRAEYHLGMFLVNQLISVEGKRFFFFNRQSGLNNVSVTFAYTA